MTELYMSEDGLLKAFSRRRGELQSLFQIRVGLSLLQMSTNESSTCDTVSINKRLNERRLGVTYCDGKSTMCSVDP